MNKTFHDSKIYLQFLNASTRSNITSNENLATSLGKISKWYTDFKPWVFDNITHDNLSPVHSKTFTGIIATENTMNDATFYFGTILPTSWTDYWSIRYRVKVYVPSNTNYAQWAEVCLYGRGDTTAYHLQNHIFNTSYRSAYYHCLYRAKSAGITSGYGHLIGESIYGSTNPTSADYKRTYEVQIMETMNCTFTFFDAVKLYANVPGTGSTNYNARTDYNFTSTAFYPDSNNTDRLQVNERPYAGTNGVKLYSIVAYNNVGRLESMTTSSGTGTSKAYYTSGKFTMPPKMFYYNGGYNYTSGTTVASTAICPAYSAIDMRYSANVTTSTGFTANKLIYLEISFDADGYWTPTANGFVQDTAFVAGRYYIQIGTAVNTYQSSITDSHPVFYYDGSKLIAYHNEKDHIGDYADYQRIVIGMVEINGAVNASTAYWLEGTIDVRRNNGLTPVYRNICAICEHYQEANMMWYSMITDYENTDHTAALTGFGFRPCIFTYNSKKYAGFEYYNLQESSVYWHGIGDGKSRPFIVPFYNHNTKEVLNSEINDSLILGDFTRSGSDFFHLNANYLTSGTVPIGRIPTGTTSTTVALGNHQHQYITSGDTRDASTTPASYSKQLNFTGIKSNTAISMTTSGAGTYSHVVGLHGWSGTSGGPAYEFATNTAGIHYRYGTTEWSSWYKFLSSENTSVTASLTSGTKIGTIKIGGTSTDLYCQTNTNTTYSLSGAYGSSSNTWVTTLTPSSGTATTSTVPTASTSVYGITKLSSATNSTSTTLAATASAVKSAYDLANGKSTVSFSRSLTSGTKIGSITIDGTATDLYCETNTNTDTMVTQTVDSTDTWRGVLLGYSNSSTETFTPTTTTNTSYVDGNLKFNPSSNILRLSGNFKSVNTSTEYSCLTPANVRFVTATDGVWARGINFYHDAEMATAVGSIGMYGEAGSTVPSYGYIGTNYSAPWLKIENNGPVRVTSNRLYIADGSSNTTSYLYGRDGNKTIFSMIGHNSSNMWIGASEALGYHHNGQTYISTGYTETSSSDTTNTNTTLRICYPKTAATPSGTSGYVSYKALHDGSCRFVGTCSTASTTAAKTVASTDYVRIPGSIISVYFSNAVNAAATLNINSTGAKSIYFETASSNSTERIPAGTVATFQVCEDYYLLLSTSKPSSYSAIKEAFLEWGGKNLAGSFGPVDAAMIPPLGANRSAYLPASAISVEYTRDGTTWTDYGLSTTSKAAMFCDTGNSAYVGKSSTSQPATATCKLRVTISTAGQLYSALNKFAIYLSTNGSSGSTCTITARLQSNVTAGTETWATIASKVSVSGWSGWNIINTNTFTTYGNTASSQYGQIRFLFEITGQNASYAGLCVTKIMCFGGVGWTVPSTLAGRGTLYSTDVSQNALFPAYVRGTRFVSTSQNVIYDQDVSSQAQQFSISVPSNFYTEYSTVLMTLRTTAYGYLQYVLPLARIKALGNTGWDLPIPNNTDHLWCKYDTSTSLTITNGTAASSSGFQHVQIVAL